MVLTVYDSIHVSKTFDGDVDANVEILNAVAGETLYGGEIDNSQNSEDAYLKFFSESPTLGTTAPEACVRVLAGEVLPISFGSDALGMAIPTKVYMACVTQGGTAGTASPTNKVHVTLATT